MKTANELAELAVVVTEAQREAEAIVDMLEEGIYKGCNSVDLNQDHYANVGVLMTILGRAGYHVFETVELGENTMSVSFKE